MPDLSGGLEAALEMVLGGAVRHATPLSGGMVNHAARMETATGPVFVKWKENAPLGFFADESDGLERLGQAGAIRVPAVLAWSDGVGSCPPFLALEYIEPTQSTDLVRFGRRFAEALARLHRENRSPDGRFGLDRPNYLGSQPQENDWDTNWPRFYRDRRLLPQMERARRLGLLPAHRERLLDEIMGRVETILADLVARSSLVHGDLWSGNFLCAAGDEPVLIDPAVHYADREVELAYIELFGGFPPGYVAAYHAAFPLDSGYAHRRPLHQLYPLLIHLNHFGESYGPDVDAVCRVYSR